MSIHEPDVDVDDALLPLMTAACVVCKQPVVAHGRIARTVTVAEAAHYEHGAAHASCWIGRESRAEEATS